MAGIDLGDAWADEVWESGVWADGVWEGQEAAGGGGAPSVAQSMSRGIRVYIGVGICLALFFLI